MQTRRKKCLAFLLTMSLLMGSFSGAAQASYADAKKEGPGSGDLSPDSRSFLKSHV